MSRTIRALAVGGLAMALTVGVTAIVVHETNRPPAHEAATVTDTTAVAKRLADPFSCPAPGKSARQASAPASDRVPAGAVLARICATRGPGLYRWSAPLDALTTDVDAVVDAYNGLPIAQALPCVPPHNETAFSVAFQYADGSLVRVDAESDGVGGCDVISIDGREDLGRADAGRVLTAFFAQLQRQRSSRTPPALPPSAAPSCPSSGRVTPSLIPSGTDLAMTAGILCHYDSMLSPGKVLGSAVLSRQQMDSIDQDYGDGATRKVPAGASCMNPDPPDNPIFGQTAWGDVVVLESDCYVYTRLGDGSQPQLFWTPSPPVQAMLDAASRK